MLHGTLNFLSLVQVARRGMADRALGRGLAGAAVSSMFSVRTDIREARFGGCRLSSHSAIVSKVDGGEISLS
jgi:hypothetical protein